MLRSYYQYWDDFVGEWSNFMHSGGTPATWGSYTRLSRWKYPCCVYNTINPATSLYDKSLPYLPEPWWGYSGAPYELLHAVCINLNPGAAGYVQEYTRLPHPLFYRQHVNRQVALYNSASKTAWETNKWHFDHRAKPIFDALKNNGVVLAGAHRLNNFLSIELLPWHTKNFNLISLYAQSNIRAIFEYSIKFAAEASRNIHNTHLRDKVIVRTSFDTFNALLGSIYNIKISVCPTAPVVAGVARSRYAVLQILDQGIDDIGFVLIWQPRARSNNFPPPYEMDAIFSEIKKY